MVDIVYYCVCIKAVNTKNDYGRIYSMNNKQVEMYCTVVYTTTVEAYL